MKLKLKTNRNDIIALWLPLFIVSAVVETLFLIQFFYYNVKDNGSEITLTVFGIFIVMFLVGILLYKFCDRKLHIFTNETIEVFAKHKQIYLINVEEIACIKYIRFNGRYMWKTISGDAMLDGDACKLYVYMKQGNCYVLGCFSRRDVKKIENLYGDLVDII